LALTARQKKFIEVFDGNATQSAIKAGYSPVGAHTAGYRLLQTTEVVRAIAERDKYRINNQIAERDERMKFLTEVMRDPSYDMVHRLKASELLSKMSGDFSSGIDLDVEANLGVVILPDVVERQDTEKASKI